MYASINSFFINKKLQIYQLPTLIIVKYKYKFPGILYYTYWLFMMDALATFNTVIGHLNDIFIKVRGYLPTLLSSFGVPFFDQLLCFTLVVFIFFLASHRLRMPRFDRRFGSGLGAGWCYVAILVREKREDELRLAGFWWSKKVGDDVLWSFRLITDSVCYVT